MERILHLQNIRKLTSNLIYLPDLELDRDSPYYNFAKHQQASTSSFPISEFRTGSRTRNVNHLIKSRVSISRTSDTPPTLTYYFPITSHLSRITVS